MRYSCLLFVAFCTLISVNAQTKNDIDTLRLWVSELHPNPYARISEAELDSAFLVTRTKLTDTSLSLNNWELSKEFGKLLSLLEDSHTLLNVKDLGDKTADSLGVFKLRLKYFNGGLYVFKDPLNIIAPGTEIKSIGGIDILEVFASSLAISPIEGDSYTSKVRVAEMLTGMCVLNEIGKPLKEVEITDVKGNTYNYPIKEKEDKKKVKGVVEWGWPEEGENEVVKLKISSFSEGKELRYYKDLNKGFKKLKKKDYNKLVIDLRGNLGGSAYRMKYLLNCLTHDSISVPSAVVVKQCKESKENLNQVYKGLVKWIIDKWGDDNEDMMELKNMALMEVGEMDTIYYSPSNHNLKNVFDGETCLLIDGLSASASVSFAAKFRELDLGQIIGESPMGPRTGTFANPITRRLPESNISVTISSAEFVLDSTFKRLNRPIAPDRWIQWSPEEMTLNKDPYVVAIEDWIKYPGVSISFEFKTRESALLFKEIETVYAAEREYSDKVRFEIFNYTIEYDDKLDQIYSDIQIIEKSNESEEEIYSKIVEKLDEKKAIIALRNSSILIKLPAGLRPTFEELTMPGRPSVLHFGIHNRADCNVCKK